MRASFLIRALAAFLLCTTLGLAQTFLGSDNFNAAGPTFNSTLWRTTEVNSFLSLANNRAEFSNGGVASNVDGKLTWPSVAGYDPNSHLTDWVATVTATLFNSGNNQTSPFLGLFAISSGGNGAYGIILRSVADVNGFVTSDFLTTHNSNPNPAYLATPGSYGTVQDSSTATNDTSDVYLRLSWNSSSGVMTSSYSFDNSTYYTASTLDLPATFGTLGNGFSLVLYGASNSAPISSGDMTFDNFSVVSAVPEPSTYAMLAGLGALGLVLWRRRAMKT